MNPHGPPPTSAGSYIEGSPWGGIPSTMTMSALVAVCFSLAAVACAARPHPKAQTAQNGGGPPVGVTDIQARAQSPEPAPVPPALRRFARSVDALERSPDRSHESVIRALRAAAEALGSFSTSSKQDLAGVRAAAARIEESGPDSERHADDVIAGLQQARRGLRALRTEPSRAPAFEAALAELDREVGALASSRPLLDQRPTTVRAFRALANAAFVAAGQNAPFVGQSRSTVATPSVDELMARLRSDTSALASADARTLRIRAADGLLSLAELVSELEAERATGQAQEIRFQAERLRRQESAPFARAAWVERGLLAALQALDSLETCQRERLDDWVEMARRAATDLPEHGTLSFQHAPVQDAFRATVDAFGVALLDKGACSRT